MSCLDRYYIGMDLRTYIATAALQGLASNEPYLKDNYAAQKAVVMADQLIAELGKKNDL